MSLERAINNLSVSIKSWPKLLRLGLKRKRSVQDYQALQHYIAEASVDEIEARGVKFAKSLVLELGAGMGGYSLTLSQRAKDFVASDIRHGEIIDGLGVPFTQVDATQRFPFEDDGWDLVYCSSLIEHIDNPQSMLQECWRVLRPGGWLYLSFPPFYSLSMIGGHRFKPFHFLGEWFAVRIASLFHRKRFRSYATCYGVYGLYPLTIDQVKAFVLDAGFDLADVYTRMSLVNTAKLPGFLKDLMTWHVCYLARKPLV